MAQAALDEIHRISLLLGSTQSTSSALKRVKIGLLKDLQAASDLLFRSHGTDIAGCNDTLQDVNNTITKLKICQTEASDSTTRQREKELEVEDYSLYAKLELENDMDLLSLSYISRCVKQIESTFQFQLQLWQEKQSVHASLNCSTEQLTYGSTNFSLWHRLMTECTAIKEMLAPALNRAQHVAIFGSSQGLLAFYTSAMYPAAIITGYEILPSLSNIANMLKKKFTPDSPINFLCEDMFGAAIRWTSMVVLTSLCWDAETRKRVAEKLSKELVSGAIVVDYRSNTFSEWGLELSNSHYSSKYHPAHGPEEHHESNATVSTAPSRIRNSCSHDAMAILRRHAQHASISKAPIERLINALSSAVVGSMGKVVGGYPSTSDKYGAIQNDQDAEQSQGLFRLVHVLEGGASWAQRGNQSVYVYQKMSPVLH